MTEPRTPPSPVVRRLLGRRAATRATTIGLVAVVAASCALVVTFGYQVASAGDGQIVGTPVDTVAAQNLTLAALSCPTLTGPRLAAQVLQDGTLARSVFKTWMPWPDANPSDPKTTYYALAHDMCDLVGQVRKAGVSGDPWQNALAAYHDGIPAVRSAGGVPTTSKTYVDTVDGYATWYAKQSVFGRLVPQPTADPSTSALRLAADGVEPVRSAFVEVPADEVAAVVTAGSVCPQVTPIRVAAQLMASSGFDPNLRSATGQLGIAQFQTDVWSAYASASASPWTPSVAIPLLGIAMCDLVRQLGAVNGDPYQLALAAFRVGPTAVRQAMGVPDLPGVKVFIDDVLNDTDHYALEPRLALAVPASPSPSVTPSTSPSQPRSPSPTPVKSPSPNVSPAPTLYKIVSVLTGKYLSPLGHSTQKGYVLVQHSDTASRDQLWQLVDMGGGVVRIKNAANGLSAAVFVASMDPKAVIVQDTDDINTDHEWRFVDTGGGVYKVQNVHSGLLMAIDGMSQSDDANVTQFGDNGTADHLWRLVPAG